MRVFFDMEFTGLTQDAEPLSIGCIAQTGQCFYAEFIAYEVDRVTPWVREHVLPHMLYASDRRPLTEHTFPGDEKALVRVSGYRGPVAEKLRDWLAQWDKVEMWGDVPAYDWVLFCGLFSGRVPMPANVHYICRDFATLLEVHGEDPDLDRRVYARLWKVMPLRVHNALDDARILRACFENCVIEHVLSDDQLQPRAWLLDNLLAMVGDPGDIRWGGLEEKASGLAGVSDEMDKLAGTLLAQLCAIGREEYGV